MKSRPWTRNPSRSLHRAAEGPGKGTWRGPGEQTRLGAKRSPRACLTPAGEERTWRCAGGPAPTPLVPSPVRGISFLAQDLGPEGPQASAPPCCCPPMRPLGERGGTLVSGPGPGWVTAQPGPAVQEGGGGESPDPVPTPQGRSHPVPTCLSGSNQPAWLSKLVQIPKPPLSRETLYPSGRLSPSLSLHVASCAPGSVPRSVGPQPDGPRSARSSFLLPEPWLPWVGAGRVHATARFASPCGAPRWSSWADGAQWALWLPHAVCVLGLGRAPCPPVVPLCQGFGSWQSSLSPGPSVPADRSDA
ncbi:cleavage and polyadenylation specificity factor subunit 6-like isoform X2 [Prionailurus viverrinus]|uniref:cleavage and polyadenylation specificity factor subunit 6-like isoform X2 n=1 Tax=Prionailurus viverrinus TaxID=61388 RepID=UPI001FF6B608|nr:cleavage and polyadenylation specificity factor subunit 6-like isoform X2 [Prionailurus viverrinus]